MRVVRIVARWLIVLVVVAAVGGYAVLATPLFSGFRQSTAQNMLARIFDRPAVVEGNVSVQFEGGFKVVIEDVKLPPDDVKTTPLPDQFIRKIDFVLPYSKLFSGAGSVSKFHISGIQHDFGDIVDDPSSTAIHQAELGVAYIISDFLNSDLSADLHVSDVLATYRNSAEGWDEKLRIDEIVSRLSDDGQFVEIEVSAEINGTEFTSSGRVQSVRYDKAVQDLPFQIVTAIPGATSEIEGTVNVTGPSATLTGDARLKSESIGQLLTDLGFQRTVDGTMTLSAKLDGQAGSLGASGLKLDAAISNGDTLTVSGNVADMLSGDGVALDFSVSFDEEASRGQTNNILDLEIVGFRGHLEGSVENLGLSQTVVRTNVVHVELEEIGPISIGRIVKDEQNRLGLQDIRIMDGPPERPTLQLQGRIDDLLGFNSVRLEGSLDFPMRSVLGLRPADDTIRFGRFSGSVIVSDDEGTLGIDRLDGTVVDTDLWSLTVAFVLDEIRHLNQITLDVDFSVPDVKEFASAAGQSVEAEGELTFAGDLLLRDKELEFRGNAQVIDTEIDGQIAVGAVDGRQQIFGSLKSEHVRLSDLSVPIELFSVDVPDNLDLEVSEDIQKSLRLALDLDFAKITGEKKATGKLVGHLEYADEIATLSDFALGYLGGTIGGTVTGNFKDDVPAYAADLRIKKWRMGRLLGELGLRAPITGTVYLDVELQAWGENPRSWARSMTGYATGSLWGGRVPGRLLDLTGLNLVSWLAAKDSKTDSTKLVCVVVPVRMKQGVANGNRMIIETDNVQIVGGGSINFRNGGLKLAFMPRPKKQQLIDIVSPFRITGTFSNPKVHLEGGGKGGRAFAEVVALPFNLVGQIFTGNKPKSKKERPCVLPKNTRPK